MVALGESNLVSAPLWAALSSTVFDRGSAEDDRTPEEKATFDRALKVRRAPTSLAAHTALCPPPAAHSPQRLPAPLDHRA